MRTWAVLLVFILCFSIVGFQSAKSDQGGDFLDLQEEQVQLLAEEAIVNDAKKCELVETCSPDPSGCTRGVCNPRLDDVLECTTVAENRRCNTSQPCQHIRVNYNRGYVRYQYPRYDGYDGTGSGDSVRSEMLDSICSQRLLDPLFSHLLEEQRKKKNFDDAYSTSYIRFYFGTVTGMSRSYPGLEVLDCSGYDPRIRRWYTDAISVVKDIVVLLDTGASMNAIPDNTLSKTSVEIAEILAQNLLKTLTSKDRGTVIGFDSTQTTILSQIDVPETGLDVSSTEFQDQLLRINRTRAPAPSGPSNYSAALMKAISTLKSNSLDALKIVVLFTDGTSVVPTEPQLATVFDEFTNQSVRLFIFQVSEISSSFLNTTACSLQGHHENLDPLTALQNPLYSLNSYFSFLVRSNIDAVGSTKPFWQKVYNDFSSLDPVITAAYPAVSSDGHLIGVAGIDIRTRGLPQILQDQFEGSLRSRRTQIPINNVGIKFDSCTARIGGGNEICKSNRLNPICVKDDYKTSYKDLVCCGKCRIDETPGSPREVIKVVVPLVAILTPAGGAIVIFLYLKFWRPRQEQPSQVDIVKVPKFSYEKLALATNGFSDSKKLGQGTFGVVYVGTLDSGVEVAVKKLHFHPDHDFKDFEAEIRILATANHNNLVALQGFCIDQHYVLVYELVENGDLDDWLFEKPLKSDKVLPWAQRVMIAKGTARGLAYLHEELQNHQKVCHSDIKPANILLDRDFNPKLADFGMAMLYEGGTELYAIGGTLGYMAPEVLSGEAASTKADVYSYGMVLLEMVTGRRFTAFTTQTLRQWTISRIFEGQETELVDPLLKSLDEADQAMAKTLLSIALGCTRINQDSRPDMSAVVTMIEGCLPISLYLENEQPHHNVGLATSKSFSQSGDIIGWEEWSP